VAHSLQALLDRVRISRRELDEALDGGAVDPDLILTTPKGSRKIADLDAAERQLRAYLEAHAASDTEASERLYDLEAESARRMHWAACREELRYRTEAGNLLDRLSVVRALATAALGLRERMLQIPGQLAADLATMDDVFEIETVMRATIEDALRDFTVKIGPTVLLDGSE
jgi:hypothetical protein